MTDDTFTHWLDALQKRHMANLTFSEIRRAVQALSSLYVERRERIGRGAALSGAGKRAAFATYYAPLHFLLVREIVRALHAQCRRFDTLIDLGCGTGSAGAAWAAECSFSPKVLGLDVNSWAVAETRWTYKAFELRGTARVAGIQTARFPESAAVVAAFVVNELDSAARGALIQNLIDAAARGAPILVVESVARRSTSWWESWRGAFESAGGSSNEWRFPIELPPALKKMDQASGLNHRELTGRSLWLDTTRVRVAGHVLPKLRTSEY